MTTRRSIDRASVATCKAGCLYVAGAMPLGLGCPAAARLAARTDPGEIVALKSAASWVASVTIFDIPVLPLRGNLHSRTAFRNGLRIGQLLAARVWPGSDQCSLRMGSQYRKCQFVAESKGLEVF